MGYQVHIEREGDSISEAEWRQAVEAVEGVRMASGGRRVARNPMTGQGISMPGPVGDAELYFPEDCAYDGLQGRWLPIFQYSSQGVSINAAFDWEDPDDPVRSAIQALAERLGASVVGDDGETYDF